MPYVLLFFYPREPLFTVQKSHKSGQLSKVVGVFICRAKDQAHKVVE